jgi:hypothetical protein
MIIKLSGAYLMILFTRTIWWNITKLCMWDYYFFETNMWDYYSLSTIKSGKRMHQSTLRIGILLYIAATLSSLIIYDCFISIPQLGHFAGGLLIPIDSARTISLDIQNLKVHFIICLFSHWANAAHRNKPFHLVSCLSSLLNLRDLPFHFSALANVEELELECRNPPGITILVQGFEPSRGAGYRRELQRRAQPWRQRWTRHQEPGQQWVMWSTEQW